VALSLEDAVSTQGTACQHAEQVSKMVATVWRFNFQNFCLLHFAQSDSGQSQLRMLRYGCSRTVGAWSWSLISVCRLRRWMRLYQLSSWRCDVDPNI